LLIALVLTAGNRFAQERTCCGTSGLETRGLPVIKNANTMRPKRNVDRATIVQAGGGEKSPGYSLAPLAFLLIRSKQLFHNL
jgi:hypothetical protein